jgi:hypothetical protein
MQCDAMLMSQVFGLHSHSHCLFISLFWFFVFPLEQAVQSAHEKTTTKSSKSKCACMVSFHLDFAWAKLKFERQIVEPLIIKPWLRHARRKIHFWRAVQMPIQKRDQFDGIDLVQMSNYHPCHTVTENEHDEQTGFMTATTALRSYSCWVIIDDTLRPVRWLRFYTLSVRSSTQREPLIMRVKERPYMAQMWWSSFPSTDNCV